MKYTLFAEHAVLIGLKPGDGADGKWVVTRVRPGKPSPVGTPMVDFWVARNPRDADATGHP